MLVKIMNERYVEVTWPEIQDYMFRTDYQERSRYDAQRDVYLIPESWLYDLKQ